MGDTLEGSLIWGSDEHAVKNSEDFDVHATKNLEIEDEFSYILRELCDGFFGEGGVFQRNLRTVLCNSGLNRTFYEIWIAKEFGKEPQEETNNPEKAQVLETALLDDLRISRLRHSIF
jgi:hypothetical protein